jgi:pimeloyl-ACP methyl ester carboxylesterase
VSDPVFKGTQARERIADWYERFEAEIGAPTDHLEVQTRLGPNHVLAAGDPSRPVLVCIHGAMGSSAHTVRELNALLDRYYLLAPDIPGQSVRAIAERLPLDTDAHGEWLLDILDGLEIERASLCAISWGGFVGLQTAQIAPGRIDRLALLVPAGVVNGPFWEATRKVMFPLVMYRLFTNEKRLRRLMEGLTTTWDEAWAHYLGDALTSFKMDMRPPPLARSEDLAAYDAPTLVVAADNDLSFPGRKLLDRMETLIPHAETELLEECRHMPPTTDEFRAWMADRIHAFLEGESAPARAVSAPG